MSNSDCTYGSIRTVRYSVPSRHVAVDANYEAKGTGNGKDSRCCRIEWWRRNVSVIALLLLLIYLVLALILACAFYVYKYEPERSLSSSSSSPNLVQMIVSRTVRKPAVHLVSPPGCQSFLTVKARAFYWWKEQFGTNEFSLSRDSSQLSSSVEGLYFVYASLLAYNHPLGNMSDFPNIFVGRREVGKSVVAYKQLAITIRQKVRCRIVCSLQINFVTYLYRNQSLYVGSFDNGMGVRMCPAHTYFGAVLLNAKGKDNMEKK